MIIKWSPPTGHRYEDNYGQYLGFFKRIAACPFPNLTIDGAPWSWAPLLTHLNCRISNPIMLFEHCPFMLDAVGGGFVIGVVRAIKPLDRTLVEVLCGVRPELVDALYKLDTGKWPLDEARRPEHEPKREFIVTTNGSFFRPEVLEYINGPLAEYQPTKSKLLLVPCAADKPYPSPMHKACMDMMPDDYYIACATGVLGIVPQDLWPVMPHYDSGIPNQWRLYGLLSNYLLKHPHKHVIVYCDFYGPTIAEAAQAADMLDRTTFAIPIAQYDAEYEDLLSTENLARLRAAFIEEYRSHVI